MSGFRFRSLVWLAVGLMAVSCGSRKAQFKEHQVMGDTPQRIARVTAIIAKRVPPPSLLLEAQFVEEQYGDGVLGPSDFKSFAVWEIAPADVEKWTALMTPLSPAPDYAEPKKAHHWWIDRADFSSLRFYRPEALTQRDLGWIGVDPAGKIYLHTFTM